MDTGEQASRLGPVNKGKLGERKIAHEATSINESSQIYQQLRYTSTPLTRISKKKVLFRQVIVQQIKSDIVPKNVKVPNDTRDLCAFGVF
jgi:hypothetical protein